MDTKTVMIYGLGLVAWYFYLASQKYKKANEDHIEALDECIAKSY